MQAKHLDNVLVEIAGMAKLQDRDQTMWLRLILLTVKDAEAYEDQARRGIVDVENYRAQRYFQSGMYRMDARNAGLDPRALMTALRKYFPWASRTKPIGNVPAALEREYEVLNARKERRPMGGHAAMCMR